MRVEIEESERRVFPVPADELGTRHAKDQSH